LRSKRTSEPLLPRQNGFQIPEFGFHFAGIGHSIGDFLAEELAVPLAKPVNGHFERYNGASGTISLEGRGVFDSNGGGTFDVIYRDSVCGPNLEHDRR
jgi:hypothetical protein